MKGCLPLTEEQALRVRGFLEARPQAPRNVCLFVLGLRTGFRISQLLALTVGDVADQRGQIARFVYAARSSTKGKREGQRLPLHEEARAAIAELLEELRRGGRADPSMPLFQSRKGGKRLNRRSAWDMLTRAFDACGLVGKYATHTMRKTFARRMRELVGGDLHKLKKLLAHTDIRATEKYLDFDTEELEAAVLK